MANEDRNTDPGKSPPQRDEAGDAGLLTPRGRRLLLPAFLLLILIVAFGTALSLFFSPAIATPDANGYWAQGTLIAETGRSWFTPESNPQYIGGHWLITPEGRYYSRYPPGLAVAIASVSKIFGPEASLLINPVASILTLIGFSLVMGSIAGLWWGVAASAILAVNPTFFKHAVSCDSHMAVTFLLVWGIWLLLLWSEKGRLWQAFTAGLFLGAIPTVRYPEAVFALPVAVFLLLHYRKRKHIWRHWLCAAVGALLPVVPLLIHNQMAFGAFWRTAYALTNEQTGFKWEYFTAHAVSYIQCLHSDGAGLIFLPGIIGMITMCGLRKHRAPGWLFSLLAIPILLVYMAYYWAPERMAGATMRFLLPTFVCYIAAGLWIIHEICKPHPPALRVGLAITVIALQAIWGIPSIHTEGTRLAHQKRVLATITEKIRETVNPDDVIMGNRQLLQHLDFLREWRLANPHEFRPGRRIMGRFLSRRIGEDTPAPMQLEKHQVEAEKYSDAPIFGREKTIASELREWADKGEVYFVGTEEELDRMIGFHFNHRLFETAARVSLPAPPVPRRGEGMLGAGMRDMDRGLGAGSGLPGPPDRGRMDDRRLGRGPGKPGRPGRRDAFMGGGEVVIARWTWEE